MRKIKSKLLVGMFLGLGVASIQAQHTVVSAGGDAIGTDGTMSYSLGQVAYITTTGSTGTVAQGIQQSYEIVTLGANNFPEITLNIVLYPNPATSFVNLKIEKTDIYRLEFQLFDINGKQILNQKINQIETKIEIQNLPSTIYYLNVLDQNKKIKTFKIIKND
jgi:Secretion system C-terminal sorting domain